MLKQFLKRFRALLTVVFVCASGLLAIAQEHSQQAAQPVAQPMAQPATPPTAQTKKSSASITCDGALDIVPAKAMSFVRKRRPNKTDGKQQTPPATAKPASNSKSGQ